MNIKKNDTVIVLSGKDKGVKGKVLTAMPKENKVIVEKVNVATCHTKPRRQGEAGGIVKLLVQLFRGQVLDFLCLHHYSPPISVSTSLVMIRVLMGSLCCARRRASRATSSVTPPISNITF